MSGTYLLWYSAFNEICNTLGNIEAIANHCVKDELSQILWSYTFTHMEVVRSCSFFDILLISLDKLVCIARAKLKKLNIIA
jgi:hypothetical protein